MHETREFIAERSNFNEMRQFIDSFYANQSNSARFHITLIVEELFCNSIEHGYQEVLGKVWLTIARNESGCHVTYMDQAPEFDPVTANFDPKLNSDLQSRPSGGLGLLLIKELSESIHYERRGDHNLIEFTIPSNS